MPVAPTTAKVIAEKLSSRELAISMELTAELDRLLGANDCPDATALFHSEVVGALRRLHVRLEAASHCDCTQGRHYAAWCKSRPNPQRRSTLDEYPLNQAGMRG